MRIVITGGHFSPAFALSQELIHEGHEVFIAGRKTTFEGDNAPSYEYIVSQKFNIPFFEIKTGRLQRKITKQTFPSLLKTPKGLIEAFLMLGKTKPDVVVVFGGYISIPIALAAYVKRIPVVVHEQTQKAGLANRYIARFAKKVCITFESSKKYFPEGKVVVTGNPIRKEIFEENKKVELPEGQIIYVTGGSSGSHFLNSLVQNILPQILKDFVVVHQTGNSKIYDDFNVLNEIREKLPDELKEKYKLLEFVDPEEIGYLLKHASLVISRSGINTILELMALRKVSLLIPFPYGQHDEQLENAKLVKEVGLGEYLEQDQAEPQVFLEKIRELINNKSELIKNTKVPKVFTPHASGNVIKVLLSLKPQK